MYSVCPALEETQHSNNRAYNSSLPLYHCVNFYRI